jgi:transcriptional regulator with GAF, ATPase, and Fis domain
MREPVTLPDAPVESGTALVGASRAMHDVCKAIGRVAAKPVTVLIRGETGTGKELIARAIYQHGLRAKAPFIAINCAAIPENLLESELFGHERGAFTGASAQRIGKFEQCNHGTIFLDEIGDMTPATQTKILRVLQSGTFERVGGNQPIKVDVRVIAATNRPLEHAVATRQFREDLFYRLNVVRIEVPPLRERRGDIRLLVNYFFKKFAQHQKQLPKSISPHALAALEQYSWPGNVRELENNIQRALVVAKGEVIVLTDLPAEVVANRPIVPAGGPPLTEAPATIPVPPAPAGGSFDLPLLVRSLFQWARKESQVKVIPAVERELIIEALKETQGNQVQAAKLLGITRSTLRKRVEKFKIKQELEIK